MKFLIAGFGSIGRRHFRNLKALGQEDILFLRSGRGQLPDEELEGFASEAELGAALGHKPDAVIVSNPTALHLDVAIPAAQAGCHLLLEKPIAHSLERVDELREALEAGGGQVLVGFQYRYHPGLLKMKEVLASCEMGRVLTARGHWGEYLPNWHPWEDYREGYSARADLGGGVVLTLSHPFDYLGWLVGEVERVWGNTRRSGELEIEVEDVAEVGLEFAGGSTAHLQLDYLWQPAAHWLEILCARGSLMWDAQTGYFKVFRREEGELEEFPPPRDFERNDLFLAQMRHFIEVVQGEAEPNCTLEDGVRALEIALAVHRSAETGNAVSVGG